MATGDFGQFQAGKKHMDVPALRDPISADAVDKIVSFLPRPQALRPDEVVVNSPVQIDEEGRLIVVSLHGEYHQLVGELLQALYKNGFVRNFNWVKWQRQAIGPYGHPERLDKARMMTCVKLLTLHARKDHFCDGHFGCNDLIWPYIKNSEPNREVARFPI